jgi:hypothetical protein
MITTDLDGTLLNHQRQVSARDRATLEAAGAAGIVRVIATGRSLYSARKVLTDDLPIDYLVYSSGVAAVRWPHGDTVFANQMSRVDVASTVEVLRECECDFMVQRAAPDSHSFAFLQCSDSANPDFKHRIELYKEHAHAMDRDVMPDFEVSQFVVVHPHAGGVSLYEQIRSRLPQCNVVRTTSPLDGLSVWIEIFPAGTSKADGCKRLARAHGLSSTDVMGVGNDFNDLDLLAWVGAPFVVANSPEPLRQIYPVVGSHLESGFSDSVERWLAER